MLAPEVAFWRLCLIFFLCVFSNIYRCCVSHTFCLARPPRGTFSFAKSSSTMPWVKRTLPSRGMMRPRCPRFSKYSCAAFKAYYCKAKYVAMNGKTFFEISTQVTAPIYQAVLVFTKIYRWSRSGLFNVIRRPWQRAVLPWLVPAPRGSACGPGSPNTSTTTISYATRISKLHVEY